MLQNRQYSINGDSVVHFLEPCGGPVATTSSTSYPSGATTQKKKNLIIKAGGSGGINVREACRLVSVLNSLIIIA